MNNNRNQPVEAEIIAIRATAKEASTLKKSLLAKTTIVGKKIMKKYLCREGASENFLIEAENIQQAEIDAKYWNMTVEAVWYDHPDNQGLDDTREFM